MIDRKSISVRAEKRGLKDIRGRVQNELSSSAIENGLCNLFIHHTSASLIISENADPDVGHDLDTFFARIAPDGDPIYRHRDEGADDMPAHIRSVLTATSLCIPIENGRLMLGTWQGIYLYEHRERASVRKITITLLS